MDSSRRSKSKGTGAPAFVRGLTAGDMARMLGVDLKTIHNWVRSGHLFGRRTKGRHLRFDRTEAVRFLRRFGYPIPAALGRTQPRVLVDAPRAKGAKAKSAAKGVALSSGSGLFDTILELATGEYEVLVLDLDRHALPVVEELVGTLDARDDTRAVAIVGVSRNASKRRSFLAAGGDLALPSAPDVDVAGAARYLTGGLAQPPDTAVVRQPEE